MDDFDFFRGLLAAFAFSGIVASAALAVLL